MSTRWFGFAAGLFMLASACGSSSTNNQCGGHGQPACAGDEFKMLEGGEVRLELRVQPDARQTLTVAQSWLVDMQTPAKLPGPMFNACSNLFAYENALVPHPSTIMTRHYVDVGDKITITGGGKTFDLAKTMNGADFLGNVQGLIYEKDMKSQGGVDASMIPAQTDFTIQFADGDKPTDTLYMPEPFTTVQGAKFDGSMETVDKTKDYVYKFTGPDSTKANIAFLVFLGITNGMPSSFWTCFGDNTGTITFPAAQLGQIDPAGLIWVGVIRHKQTNFKGRNLDLIGVNCKQQAYKVQ